MNLTTVLILSTGGILIYCGIKDRNPRDVIFDAIQGQSDPGNRGQQASASAAPSVHTTKPDKGNDSTNGGAVGV